MDADEWRAEAAVRRRDWERWLRTARRWLTAAWAFAVALNVALLGVVCPRIDSTDLDV
jgi:hypothetical protein